MDSRIKAAQCYFATDIHSETLGPGSDSLTKAAQIEGELVMIVNCLAGLANESDKIQFGAEDNHVPFEGRTKIREQLNKLGKKPTFIELNGAQHAFIRDDSSKSSFHAALSRFADRRYSASWTRICFEILLDLFERNLCRDLGERKGPDAKLPDVC
jgi:dienelactone hydrolase